MALTRTQQVTICHPFIKWAGGKTQLLPELSKFVPSRFERYFEPFLGGGAMFFHLAATVQRPFHAFLSDKNVELINAYQVVKNDVDKLIFVLKRYKRDYATNPMKFYYDLRDESRPISAVGKAARFLTLNRTCYNGLYRANKKGRFNVPFGGYSNPNICDEDNLRAAHILLQHLDVTISTNGYENALETAAKDDFVFLDPPYVPVSRTASFTEYLYGGFGVRDQEAVAAIFKELDDGGCKVMLTNSETPVVRSLYKNYMSNTTTVKAMRYINCKGSKRGVQTELIIRNY